MARAAAGDAQAARIARGGPYVYLKGGPYHGAFYSVVDWATTRDAERWGLEEAAEQRPQVMGLYRETKDVHASTDPKLPGLAGKVWRWTGKVDPMNQAGRKAR